MGHDGGAAAGEYCQTLDLTDIATTWTETMAVRNKAQARVFEALQKVRKNLPFLLLGLDSDNGSEFINDELLRYCKQERIELNSLNDCADRGEGLRSALCVIPSAEVCLLPKATIRENLHLCRFHLETF